MQGLFPECKSAESVSRQIRTLRQELLQELSKTGDMRARQAGLLAQVEATRKE